MWPLSEINAAAIYRKKIGDARIDEGFPRAGRSERRRVRNAPAIFKIFRSSPEKDFFNTICQIWKSLLLLDHVVQRITEPQPTPILTCYCLTTVFAHMINPLQQMLYCLLYTKCWSKNGHFSSRTMAPCLRRTPSWLGRKDQNCLALHRTGQTHAERLLQAVGCETSLSKNPCSSASIAPETASRIGPMVQ
jgi:hypothetical protein